MNDTEYDICIIGAGPAGAVLGLCMAQLGYSTLLLDKNNSFKREFRGESIAPDSVMFLDKLGILEELQKFEFLKTTVLELYQNDTALLELNFKEANYASNYIMDIPQPYVLEAIINKAREYPNFEFQEKAKCKRIIFENNKIIGCLCEIDGKDVPIRAKLTVAADGRYSQIRELTKLIYKKIPSSRDVIWLKLPKPNDWGDAHRIYISEMHQVTALQTYPDSLRLGITIPKKSFKMVKEKGISHLHDIIKCTAPRLANLAQEHLKDFNNIGLLDIFTVEMKKWHLDGLVLIGDAAHTMSPVLGQGVNQAIQDAVLLSDTLHQFWRKYPRKPISEETLESFTRQRRKQVNFIHKFQQRQEKMLKFKYAALIFYRKLFYISINRWKFIKRILFRKIYFPIQSGAIHYKLPDNILRNDN